MSFNFAEFPPGPSLDQLFVASNGATYRWNGASWVVVTGRAQAFDSVNSPHIVDQGVATVDIADGAVTEPKLANGAVTTNKLADDSVTVSKLANNSVSTSKLTDNAVATDKIIDDAVTTLKIANGAVTEPKLANGAVTTAKILDAAVESAKLANGAVSTVKIVDEAVTAAKIANGAIDNSAKVVDGVITEAKLDPALAAKVNQTGTGDIKSDGTVDFTAEQKGVDATSPTGLTTKQQVDAALAAVAASIAAEAATRAAADTSLDGRVTTLETSQSAQDTAIAGNAAAITAEATARAAADALLVPIAAIVNDLTTGGALVPLSAEQGKTLNQLILAGVGTSTTYGTLAARDADVTVNDGDIAYVTNFDGAGHWSFYVRASGAWVQLLDQVSLSAAVTGSLQRDGSVQATGDIPFGGFKATNLANPAAAQDAATKAYVDRDHVAAELPLRESWAGAALYSQIVTFTGQVPGTTFVLGVVPGLAKLIRTDGFISNGADQMALNCAAAGWGGATEIHATGTTVHMTIGVAGYTDGEVCLVYTK